MKKIYTVSLICLLLALSFVVQSQTVLFSSGFENWTSNLPDNWVGIKTNISHDSIIQYTTSVHSGTYAVRLNNGSSTHKRFTTMDLQVDSAEVYTLTFWVRGHGNIRTGLYDGRSALSGYFYNAYIAVNSTNWTQQTQTITCAKTNTAGEFILSVQSTVPDLDAIQVDDLSITYGTGPAVPKITITNPVEGSVVYGTSATIDFTVLNFIVGNPGTGIDGHIHYYVDGGSVVMQYNTDPINLSGLPAGAHQVITQLVDNTHQPLIPNVADTVNFTTDLNPPNMATIHDIQYTTDVSGNSSYMDEIVTVGGIVTGKHAAGYFIQSGVGAWNGVYVYDNVNQPVMGDSVILTGTVGEYYNQTEIKLVTAFGIISSGNTPPAPVVVDCAGVNAEENEGVLVTASHVTCVNPSPGFGMWKIEDQSDTAKVHNLFYTYTPTLNTVYDVTGPVYYSFNEFRVEPRSAADVIIITGLEDIHPGLMVNLFPNPVQNTLTLSGTRTIEKANISNAAGQTVQVLELNNVNQVSVDVSGLEAGVYFINLMDKDGRKTVKSFIK